MKDDALLAWLRERLRETALPAMLDILKGRRANLIPGALELGDTNREKTQIAELTFVIELFEHFDKYADTETETVTS